MTFQMMAQHCQGKILQLAHPDQKVGELKLDSRQPLIHRDTIFFAIQGLHHDGHNFIQEMYQRGCRQFVVEQAPEVELPEANLLMVQNSVLALQQTVAAHRQQFSLPVVGITGSNGKTIVKEWLSQLLVQKWQVVKSPKSYNSQTGVPLSVWQINEGHQLGIFEAGISQPDEMSKLWPVIQPTLGIFTNLGPAHDEGFRDRYHKAFEKSRLFKHCQKIIYCADFKPVEQVMTLHFPAQALVSWSKTNQPAIWQVTCETIPGETVQLRFRNSITSANFRFEFKLKDEASLENVSHCIIFLLEQGWAAEEVQQGLNQLRQISMRLELKQGVHSCYLLDDTYSNDLAGLQIALNFLVQQPQNSKNTVILSDLLQTGCDQQERYQQLKQLLLAYPLHKLILIGTDSGSFCDFFEQEAWDFQHFDDTPSFLNNLHTADFSKENILIKGARVFGFEHIVQRLQQKIHSTTLEIDLDAVTHNLNVYRSALSPSTRLMVMVKAFSYGGAAFEIANLLQFHQVDYLAVAYVDEGVMLRQHGIRLPILVLNPTEDSFSLMREYRLEPEVYSLSLLAQWQAAAGTELPVHIKLDTGMHRLGFMEAELPKLLLALHRYSSVRVASIFTHLVASEDPDEDAYTHHQIQLYQRMYEQLAKSLNYSPLRHVLNSAGIRRFPEYRWEMVRLGLGLYGVDMNQQLPLKPISTLKTVISQIKYLPAGATVGYNRKGKVDHPKRIATLAIGYADGLDRRLGNGNLQVWIKGEAAPTIGNICMDMTMVDITGLSAQVGDEVIIFGEQQSVQVLAQRMGTIPYEVLTGISERVKRVFYSAT